MIMALADWLQNTSMAQFIQVNAVAFPLLEVFHVISIGLVVGSIMIVDLRLMNWCSKSYRVTRLMQTILPLTVIAFLCAFLSGFLLFSSQPVRYLHTTPFLIKMGLLLLACINMAIFHTWTQRSIAHWDEGDAIPLSARLAGFVSIVVWVGILVAGRFVGFFLSF